MRGSYENVKFILARKEHADEAHRLHRNLSNSADTLFLSKELFEELNPFGIDYPIIVCKSPEWSAWDNTGPAIICPFQNPQNLGGALRTALGFNFKVVLTKESSHPLLPKCTRAASGNIFLHNVAQGTSIHDLNDHDIIVLDKDGEDISQFDFPKDSKILVGEEGSGVPSHLNAARKVSIPISSQQESLNVLAALSIALYQYRTQYKLT